MPSDSTWPTGRHARHGARRPVALRALLAAAVAAVLATSIGATTVLAAQPEQAPLAPVVVPAPTPVPPPDQAPTTSAVEPTTSVAPTSAAEPTHTRTRSTSPRTPRSWTPDSAAEAERRLQQLQDGGPNSSLRKCLESGKLYEQCSG